MSGKGGWQGIPDAVSYTPLQGAGQSADPAFETKTGDPNYPVPANWPDIQVAARNLKVNPGALTNAATNLKSMSQELQSWLTNQAGTTALAVGQMGNWPAAAQLSDAVNKTVVGVQSLVTELQTAHENTVQGLVQSASTYVDADQSTASAVKHLATASQGWTVSAGGASPQHNNPFLGDNLTPQQQATAQRLINMNMGGGSQQWNTQPIDITTKQTKQLSVPVTTNVPFQPDTSYNNLNYDQINGLIKQPSPTAILDAANSYGSLVGTLTDMTGKLAGTAKTLSENWGGSGAVTALSNIQMLHQTTTDLQANVYSAGEAMQNYGAVLPSFQANLTPAPSTKVPMNSKADLELAMGTIDDRVITANTAARQQMAALNGHIQASYNAMPAQLNANLPAAPKPQSPSRTPGGPNGTGGGVVLPPGSGTTGSPPGSTVPPSGTTPPTGTTPTPIKVASTSPPNTTSPTGTPPVTTPTTPPVTTPVVPPVTVPSTSGLGVPGNDSTSDTGLGDTALGETGDSGLTDIPGLGGLGASGLLNGGSGASDGLGADGSSGLVGSDGTTGLAGDTTALPGDEAVGFPGMGMMGMGGFGGSSGTGSAGRVRQSWESEDDGLWDPAGDGAFAADLPGIGGDGMIGTLGPGASATAFSAADDIGAGGAFGPGGGFLAGGGYGGASGSAAAEADSAADDGMFPFMGGAGAGGGQDRESRQRQAWMNEDTDVWANAEPGIPPVIG